VWESADEVFFKCTSEGQDTFLLGALQAFFGWDLELFDVFLLTRG